MKTKLQAILACMLFPVVCFAQVDSGIAKLQSISVSYLRSIESKANKYSSRSLAKTKSTLLKLSRWEKKIRSLLEKVSPDATNELFGPGKVTFTMMLQKLNEGEQFVATKRETYDAYRNKLNTSLQYLREQERLVGSGSKQVKSALKRMDQIENEIGQTDALEHFMQERKRQLAAVVKRYLGKNRYLAKINKEAFYYAESIRNYKEIFSEPGKFENAAMELLQKMPAFRDLFEQNSGLGSLLGNEVRFASNQGSAASSYADLGYQSNSAIVQELQQRNISQSIQQLIRSNANQVGNPLQAIRDHFPVNAGADQMPGFKPNAMRSKTFKQRLEFGTNLQFGKASNYLPANVDVAIQLSYKLNNKSSTGLGAGSKIGFGKGIQDVKLSFAGFDLRSFLDWKLKGSFYINGGFEYHYNNMLKRSDQPRSNPDRTYWKPAALIGINKKYNAGKIKGNMMLLYDFFAKQKIPQTQRVVFRVGYSF